MKADFINPFLEATIAVVETMASTKVMPGKPEVKKSNKTWGAVSGIIGMVGEQVSGNLLLGFDEPSILAIVSSILGEEYSAINDDVVDAVGEMTNMVSGRAKSILGEKGYSFDMATPFVVVGKDVEITQLAKQPVISIPFQCSSGKFVVEASLHEK